ncbi:MULTISPECIES: hypothetical protein [unclassified Bradyrhizobium]|uniref:hypothetical protein n=1 Tax=unclassified Bradyrhizobium TaxID=2631580 RepID=UPI0015CE9D9A|nr:MULTISPECIES: hypothetical protein [unclassified Bradyrhizobium]MBB4259718.1 hypothetical protein [Bradyrhizobium sp. CIR3A]NYG47582.1 hypothetical protein [Bradyrhizobium sp. IAR9]
MSNYSTKVHRDVGGDQLTVEAGGSIKFGNATFSVNAAGKLIVTGLPTADPHVVGQLWANSNVLTISAG